MEPTIWTPRMVQALDDGVKGGKWYSLWDKVIAPRALEAAFAKVKANDGAAGVDRVSVEAFEGNQSTLKTLRIAEGRHLPTVGVRRCPIEGGQQGAAYKQVPTVRDRVVQTALQAAIEPIFRREFADHSYGFAHDAAHMRPSTASSTPALRRDAVGGGRGPQVVASTRSRMRSDGEGARAGRGRSRPLQVVGRS
ncbi:MAG: hypothetical protein U0326_23705 [Polyangiales bacterium]